MKYIKEYQSKQIGKEKQHEIIKLTKKYENIINEDKNQRQKKKQKKLKIK